ncbi:MAG: hypothetical protein KF763_13080 [Cyclobacteriaceae bacterium]|nr:hypothetical protein [Cyclobacteriaceae bacterium]
MIVLCSLSGNAQTIIFETNPVNLTKVDIERELAKYPNGLLSKYLKQVVVVKTDKYCGLSYGRTPRINLNDDCRCKLGATIHHELSSIFLYQYNSVSPVIDEMQQTFISLNGEYSYTQQIVHSKIEPGTKISNHFYGRMYATHSFENDFNVIAESLFVNGRETIQFMNDRPNLPVSKKIKLVLELYQKISSDFTTAYFEKQKI